jgi:ATP-binding protein involved in chromosome partitioning
MTDKTDLASQVMAQLGSVIEPELRRDLVTLNMIKDLRIEGDTASFTIMLTTPACPLKDEIERSAREAALKVEGINQVEIRLDSSVPTDRRITGRLDLPLKSLIAVSSGKGGVGKSTIAANLAVALSQSGAAVGLMDADILGPNLPTMMGVHRMPPPENNRLIPAQAFGVKLMSMGFLIPPEQPLVWRGPMLHSAIRQFFTDVEWGPLDYMVVDLPPGTGDAQLTLAQSVPLSGAIIVTQPQNVAVDDALRSLAMFEKLDVPIIGVVENMSGEFFGSGGGQRMAEQRGVPFLGSVPLDPQVRIGGDSGRPIVLEAPDSPAAQALIKIAGEVAARVSVLTLGRGDDVTPAG